MYNYIYTIRIPIFIVIINFFLFLLIMPENIFGIGGNVLFNLVRAFTFGYAGWLLASRKRSSLVVAASSGAILFFIDNVVLKGGSFMVESVIANNDGLSDLSVSAFKGAFVSFLMFFPIAVIISLIGGVLARVKL